MEGERTDPAASITFYHPRHRLCGAVTPRMPIPSRFPESFILETCTPPLRQRTAPSMAACLSLSLITLWQVVILALDLQLPCSHPQAHPVHPRWNISSPVSGAVLLSDHGGKAYPVSPLFSYRLALQHSLLSATQRVTRPETGATMEISFKIQLVPCKPSAALISILPCSP